jgi:hypothetical protein
MNGHPIRSTAPLAQFAEPRIPASDTLTVAELCHEIEARYPGWHVWLCDEGYVYATANIDGQEVTLPAAHITLVEHEIASYLHHREFTARHAGAAA